MKTIILILTVLSWSLTGTAQEIDPEGLPTATLTTGFYLTLDPEVPAYFMKNAKNNPLLSLVNMTFWVRSLTDSKVRILI